MEQQFNLVYLLKIIKSYLRFIAIVTFGVTLIAVVYAVMSENQYQSEMIIYPTNPERYDLTNLTNSNSSTFVYGTAKEVEKLSNIAKSEKVALATVDSLNLWNKYGIDKKSVASSPKFKVLKEFRGNVTISQAEGGGVLIQAYDKDPQGAANIVNTIVYFTNRYNNEMIENTRLQMLGSYQKDFDYLSHQYTLYKDSTNYVRKKYNIYSYNNQTQAVVEQLLMASSKYAFEKSKLAVYEKEYSNKDTAVINAKARMKGAESQIEMLKNGGEVNLKDFRDGIDELVHLEQTYYSYGERLRTLRMRMQELTSISDLKRISIVYFDQATISDKKARPVRWLIVVSALLMGLVSAIAAAIIYEVSQPIFKQL